MEPTSLQNQLEECQRELAAAQSQLQSSRGHFEGLLNSVMDAVVTMDSAQRVKLFNPAAERMFGYKAEDVLGKSVEILMPQRYRPSHSTHVKQFGDSGSTTRRMGSLGKVMGRRADGTEFPIEASISQNDADGEKHYTAILRDITERLKGEEETRRQIVRLDLLSQVTRSIAGRQDLQSVFTVVLRFLAEQFHCQLGVFLYFGGDSEQLLVSTPVGTHADFLRGTILEENFLAQPGNELLQRCIAGEAFQIREPSEAVGPLLPKFALAGLGSIVGVPLGGTGEILGALIVARVEQDAFSEGEVEFLRQIGEHVAIAAQQLRLLGELQQAYEDIKTSQRGVMQQERLRAMGQMASGIAHDINNALSPISLYSEALLEREKNLSPRATQYLQAIVSSSDAIAKTVASLRQFFRKREDTTSLSIVRINSILREVCEITRPRWRDMPQERGILIDVVPEFDEHLADVRASEAELRDAFVNLIFNAIDAMPQGGTITIRTRNAGSNVCIEVIDTGLGMDPATKARCLEPFFTTKGERGTGLGLSMVFGMIQRHEGELEFDTSEGKGTTVRIVLPINDGGVEPGDPVAIADSAKSLKILCIDDDPHLRESIAEILRLDQHRIVSEESGADGIRSFIAARDAGEPFDMVISDVGMPHMDGRAVAAQIKAISPHTPVVLLTGWGAQIKEMERKAEHVDMVLTKPPRLRELRAALSKLVP